MGAITGSILLLCLIFITPANTVPVINQDTYEVCGDTPLGAYAFTVQATSTEGQPLTYTFGASDYLKGDSRTGVVTTKLEIYLAGTTILFPVTVSDASGEITKTLRVLVRRANNYKPIFQGSYDVEIAENTPVGTSLFKVLAIDEDSGIPGVIRYSIDEVIPNDGFGLFTIADITGIVTLAGNLSFTSLSTFYRLKINATDGGGQCHFNYINYNSNVVYSFVSVKDVPDINPQFIGVPYIGSVMENTPVDSTVFKVNAIDPDIGVSDVIHYSIEDSTVEGLFRISRTDGVISVMSAIDREVVGDTISLTVKATESKLNIHGLHGSTTANVSINILDANDNRPEFYKCGGSGDERSCEKATSFTGEVTEHWLGSISINMTVKDPDRFSRTNLKLEGADKDVFTVAPDHITSESIVQLLVKQPQLLDFEVTQQMVVQVVATDEDQSSFHSTATVTITIKDSNDNSPKFPKDTYKLTVAEHSAVGTLVKTITAEDPDTMDKDKITYRLLPNSILQYFYVDRLTGSIYVQNGTLLDREVRSLYSATLQAMDTDGKTGTTQLEITVTDINDNRPVFNRDSYMVFVKEGEPIEVKIEATDADDPDTMNSQIVYGIEPSTYSDNFTINPNTGVLKSSGPLDLEALNPDLKGRIELNVTATDKGSPPLSAVVAVIVNVEDINDNSPQFEPPAYNFSVKEGDAFVGFVYAEDLDQTAEFNRISFSIMSGSFGTFIIRTDAEERGYRGTIRVDPDVELDYENTHKQFMLKIEATDLEQKTAVAMVEVNVLDVNDERPELKPMAPVQVKENTTISGAVGKFTGQDKDGNHSLVYKLESIKCRCKSNSSQHCSNWFILDPTGEVRLNPEYTVDYEECDQVEVEARVLDEYTEKGDNHSLTTGKMVIHIEDINDNSPQFIPSDSVFFVVSETASKGTSVAGVTATDRDTAEKNRQIDFKVTSVKFKDNNHTSDTRMLFEAITTQQKDVYVGIIQTTEGLDMSLKGKYLVTVTATDGGGLFSTTVLEIFTIDKTYQVKLGFTRSMEEVEQNRNSIVSSLIAATKATVEVVAIQPDTPEESRASISTIMVAYFVYPNGTALTSNEVEKMLSSPDHYPVLAGLGLIYIGKATVVEPKSEPVKYILLGIVGGFIILLAVLVTSLLCTRRNYQRKLKAAKAMNSASMVTSNNQKSGPVVPGTNKYTMEGANPVLNLNIDTNLVLDLDEGSSDVDKVSLNSLDYNDDMTIIGRDTKQNIMFQEEEEEEEEEYSGSPEYIEPLGEALAQRTPKKDKPYLGFNNPGFNSTTDL
ncbi:cadherin-related family member 2 [Solea senegalensis]|uniref:Cadherin-related family member 2 n=1 Tax=Solea senegalensis TaxID=28829 RepID=A0AAV6SJZ1_SOLSE|nr:cadherin-related family member 2 [Solea senegalensis]KAG7518021.1 cadherin-related family member 2 [Solea senegalensis]